MEGHLRVEEGILPKLTEQYLASQPNIESAVVTYHRGKLQAQVVLLPGAEVDPEMLKLACETVLGEAQAPASIVLVDQRPRSA